MKSANFWLILAFIIQSGCSKKHEAEGVRLRRIF